MDGYTPPLAPSALAAQLRVLGLAAGDTIMLHASMKALGTVMGGPNSVLLALLDVLTPAGTLMMYVGWHDIPDFLDELPLEEQARYRAEHPAFDPATARAVRDHGVLAECLRTWPGARRSGNPEASMAAVGARAGWVTADHPLNYGYGASSPLERLIEAGGKVLLLGSPLDTVTLLHYAENRARLRQKRVVHYDVPLLRDGRTVWVPVEDFDTGEPHGDYSFEQIMQAFLIAGHGRSGHVGAAACCLLEAGALAAFAIRWLEERFG